MALRLAVDVALCATVRPSALLVFSSVCARAVDGRELEALHRRRSPRRFGPLCRSSSAQLVTFREDCTPKAHCASVQQVVRTRLESFAGGFAPATSPSLLTGELGAGVGRNTSIASTDPHWRWGRSSAESNPLSWNWTPQDPPERPVTARVHGTAQRFGAGAVDVQWTGEPGTARDAPDGLQRGSTVWGPAVPEPGSFNLSWVGLRSPLTPEVPGWTRLVDEAPPGNTSSNANSGRCGAKQLEFCPTSRLGSYP